MNWDICLFYNEFDLLELRLQELWDVVDRFGIIEMPVTFSGKPKPLFLSEGWARFEKYSSKISRIIAPYPPNIPQDPSNPSYHCWKREHYQRSFQGCFPISDDDIVTLCDVDEIPHPDAYKLFDPGFKVGILRQMFFHYWIDGYIRFDSHDWAKICTGRLLRDYDPGEIRHAGYKDSIFRPQIVSPGGWHFSYLGDMEWIRNKLQSFSHCLDASTQIMLSKEDCRLDDLKRKKVRIVPITSDWPANILKNLDHWKAKYGYHGSNLHPAS